MSELAVSEQEVETLVDFLKVLADKTRLRILGILSEREHTVKELAATLGLKEPTVSAHLFMLKKQDLVAMRPQGTSHYYSLRQDGIHALLKELSGRTKEALPEDPDSTDFERQVLQHFFRNGKLQEIPTRHSKQLVVLRRLAQEFAFGTLYTEKQVNEILKRFHPDCATLRRYLVDNRLMTRENSVYWRLEPKPERMATADEIAESKADDGAGV